MPVVTFVQLLLTYGMKLELDSAAPVDYWQ